MCNPKTLNHVYLPRPEGLLNDSNGDGKALAQQLSPPEMPLHVLRRGSECSLPWGTSVSVESGSDEEGYDREGKDSTPADGGGSKSGGGVGTDGASDAGSGTGSGRRGSKITDLLERKKKTDKKRRKADKQGSEHTHININEN